MYLTQDAAEKRLTDLHMSDMPVIAIQPTPCRVAPDWFAQYKKLCHILINFLKMVLFAMKYMQQENGHILQ